MMIIKYELNKYNNNNAVNYNIILLLLHNEPDLFLRSSNIWPPTPRNSPKCTQMVLTYEPASHLSHKIPIQQLYIVIKNYMHSNMVYSK